MFYQNTFLASLFRHEHGRVELIGREYPTFFFFPLSSLQSPSLPSGDLSLLFPFPPFSRLIFFVHLYHYPLLVNTFPIIPTWSTNLHTPIMEQFHPLCTTSYGLTYLHVQSCHWYWLPGFIIQHHPFIYTMPISLFLMFLYCNHNNYYSIHNNINCIAIMIYCNLFKMEKYNNIK